MMGKRGNIMWRFWALLKLFRKDLVVMLLAMRHPGTPRRIKGLMLLAFLYLISPVDLIPDAIPVLGIMDDAVIVPAAICGLMRMLPSSVRADSEYQAQVVARRLPYFMLGASILIFLWVVLLIAGIYSLIFR